MEILLDEPISLRELTRRKVEEAGCDKDRLVADLLKEICEMGNLKATTGRDPEVSQVIQGIIQQLVESGLDLEDIDTFMHNASVNVRPEDKMKLRLETGTALAECGQFEKALTFAFKDNYFDEAGRISLLKKIARIYEKFGNQEEAEKLIIFTEIIASHYRKSLCLAKNQASIYVA